MTTPSSTMSTPAWQMQRNIGRAGAAISAGATAMQWGHYVPPPPPKCAETRPEHLKNWRKRSKILRHELKCEAFDYHDKHGGGGDIAGLRALLRHKYGNAARGWRIAIAPHGDHEAHDHGKAGIKPTLYSDLCRGLKTIGFSGNGKTLWNKLSGGKNVAWLEDLDPKLGESLDIIAGAIADNYAGGTHHAWKDIEREHQGRISATEFDQFLYDRDLLSADDRVSVRQVFECIALSGRGTATVEELRFLDHWAARRLKKVLPPTPVKKKKENVPWSPPPPKPPHIPDLVDFRDFLEQKFGSPARAWRVALDIKAQGSISPSEFGMACRQIGWPHPHHRLWEELKEEGKGVAGLRGIDPETCEAIDSMVETMLAEYGSLENLWTEVLDPDGDGICSRAEWLTSISQAVGLSTREAGLIFTVVDVVHAGWVAFSELGFLDDFVEDVVGRDQDDMSSSNKGLFASMSEGALTGTQRSQMLNSSLSRTEMSWRSGASPHASMGAASTHSSHHDLHLGSSQRSSRSMQNRQFLMSHMAKYRWMGEVAAAHTRSMSEGSPWATYKKEIEPKMPTVGGTPLSDVFRFTNEFYREGCRRLKHHHELQNGEKMSKQMSHQSDRSPTSSQRSPSNARSPSNTRSPGSYQYR